MFKLREHPFNPKATVNLDELKRADLTTETQEKCYGLESAGASAGIGVTFGAAMAIFTAVTIGSAFVLAFLAGGTIEGLRRANWTREAQAKKLEDRLLHALNPEQLQFSMLSIFEKNINNLKLNLEDRTFRQL